MEVETFECAVCWTKQPIEFAVGCTKFDFPDDDEHLDTDDEILTDSSESTDLEDSEHEDEDLSNKGKKATVKEDEKEHVSHFFCVDCIRAQSANACIDAPLAKGGIGLCCMENKCDGVLLLSKFYIFIIYIYFPFQVHSVDCYLQKF